MKRTLCCLLLTLLISYLRAQNVGVGTNVPLAPLHVKTSSPEVIRIEGTSPYISLYDLGSGYRGYFWSSPANKIELGSAVGSNLPVTIAPNQSQLATFLPNGNVGFGINAPTSALHVLGSTYTDARIETSSAFGNSMVSLKTPGGVNDYLQ